MKQTSVEWLREKLFKEFSFAFSDNIFEKVKEMHEQEQLEVFIEGYKQRAIASDLIFDNASRMCVIKLYNETYNK